MNQTAFTTLYVTTYEVRFVGIVGELSKDREVRALAEFGSAALSEND